MTSVTVSIQFYLISLQSIHILTAHICAQKNGHLCIWIRFWHIYTYKKKEALFGCPWDFTVCYQKRANIFCSCFAFCSIICTSYFVTSWSANMYQTWVHTFTFIFFCRKHNFYELPKKEDISVFIHISLVKSNLQDAVTFAF